MEREYPFEPFRVLEADFRYCRRGECVVSPVYCFRPRNPRHYQRSFSLQWAFCLRGNCFLKYLYVELFCSSPTLITAAALESDDQCQRVDRDRASDP